MTDEQKVILALSGTLALAGFLVGWPRLNDKQRQLTIDLVNLGLVGTLIGVPVGLYLVPRVPAWATAAALTALGFGVKMVLLPHEEKEAGVHGPSPLGALVGRALASRASS